MVVGHGGPAIGPAFNHWSVFVCVKMKDRRPSDKFPHRRWEDEFECFKCGDWLPFWFYNYHPSLKLEGPDDVDEMRDGCGHMWTCSYCFKKSHLCLSAKTDPDKFPGLCTD